jgi:hypothetical protein
MLVLLSVLPMQMQNPLHCGTTGGTFLPPGLALDPELVTLHRVVHPELIITYTMPAVNDAGRQQNKNHFDYRVAARQSVTGSPFCGTSATPSRLH